MDKESKKYREVDDKERRRDWDEVDVGSVRVGSGRWDDEVISTVDVDVGVCTLCKHVRGYRTRYGTKKIWCYSFDFILNPSDPIEECTTFSKRGEMELDEMKTLAWKIEPAKEFAMGFHPPKEEKDE